MPTLDKYVLDRRILDFYALDKRKLDAYILDGLSSTPYYYNEGVENTPFESWNNGYATATTTKEANRLFAEANMATANTAACGFVTTNKVNLTDISLLKIDWFAEANTSAQYSYFEVLNNKTDLAGTGVAALPKTGATGFARETGSLDVSALNGLYYVRFVSNARLLAGNYIKTYAYKIWGE